MTILDDILARKRDEVAAIAPRRGDLEQAAKRAAPTRGFRRALETADAPRVIAEFKRASPSKGPIRPGAQPEEIVRLYASAGACALSVLTDQTFFSGGLDDLERARATTPLPVLRKDFTIDPLQVIEARAVGADAILLIVAALSDAQIDELRACAIEQALDVLVEVHTEGELARALHLGCDLIGINNRDLKTFVTDVGVTRALLPQARGCTVVSESGIADAETVRELVDAGVDAFLVGESLMREPDPALALARLRGAA